MVGMGKLCPTYALGGIMFGAITVADALPATALVRRYVHSTCFATSTFDVFNYSDERGFWTNYYTGDAEFTCPVVESTDFTKADATEVKIYYEDDGSPLTLSAKVCITRRHPSSPLSSYTCSNPTQSSTNGFSSVAIASLSTWTNASYANEYPYVVVKLPGGSFSGTDSFAFRGIAITY